MRNFTNLYLYSECLLPSSQESHLEQSEGLFVMHEDMGRQVSDKMKLSRLCQSARAVIFIGENLRVDLSITMEIPQGISFLFVTITNCKPYYPNWKRDTAKDRGNVGSNPTQGTI